jgi:hypothetical protein
MLHVLNLSKWHLKLIEMYGHWLTKGKVLRRRTWQGGGVGFAIAHITQYDL